MSDPIIDRLDQIKGRADKATEGPWEWDADGEVSQHWSRPEPCCTVVSTEVVCMAYCYGGSARGIGRGEDGEFIAAARTDVPQMEQALRAVLDLHKRRDDLQHPNGGPICDGCGDLDGWESAWPCPPVRAIADALGVETEGGES